jgi:hypothetical protein
VTAVGGSSTGIQLAGAITVADRLHGLQASGGAAAAARIRGLQVAGGASVAGRVDGAQIAGGINVAGDVHGVQIAPLNIARRVRGAQIGVINISDDGNDSFPIGVINYSRNGDIGFDGWIDSSRVSALAFRHGTRHIHNIWSIGWSPDHDNMLVGAGLGIRVHLASALGLDIDAMHWLTDLRDVEYGQINQLRASLAFPIASSVEVFGGVAANVYINDVMQDNSMDFHPTIARRFEPTAETTVSIWGSAFAGVRLKAR